MKINPTIFREYDIRGIAGKEFSEKAVEEYKKWYGDFPGVTINLETAKIIGQAYGTIIKRGGGNNIVVGHEIRPFADELTNAFIEGIGQSGSDVTDLGVSLTPIVYFNTAVGKFDGGVNVTGSHNVYFYNGFKLMKKDVWPLFGEELQKMRQMIEKGDLISDKTGDYKKSDGYAPYKEYFLKNIKLEKKLKIVIDCGNGSAGVFAPDLFRALGSEVIELYSEPDATFPNHPPDPQQRQFMSDLGKKVKAEMANLGIAFDADGDRVGFVDENGEFIEADYMLLLFAKDALLRNPGKKIVYDVRCSALLEELIPSYGGLPFMHRTGHAPIKETIKKDGKVIFAGEVSGHFYFVENYFGFDDGLFAAAKLLEILSQKNEEFSYLFKEIPKRILTPEFQLPCQDTKKFGIVRQITENLSQKFTSITIDGVRIKISKTGWGLIRASNTSPYISVRAEGIDENEVLKIKNILADELDKFPEIKDKLDRSKVAVLAGKLGWI